MIFWSISRAYPKAVYNFARRPAPVQVTWLGYPNTTGMQAMDYRLTDSIADPEGDADRLHTERLMRLPQGFLCYQPLPSAPEVAQSPALRTGHLTFGSFNTLAKLTTVVIQTWTEFCLVPGARLVLKDKCFPAGSPRSDTWACLRNTGSVLTASICMA
jgi:predicted O-linked N-acetylglucosamine transferase (SPINDLY family)